MSTPGYPYYTQQFVADGTDRYTLDETVTYPYEVIVSVNGLVQLPAVDYDIGASPNEIIFNSVPIQGSDVEIRFFGPIDPGYMGSTGYQGSLGDRGETGYRGSLGQQGATGYTGSSGVAEVYISENAPSGLNVTPNMLWWDSDNAILNIYYTDEDTWVGIAEGPQGRVGYTGSEGSIGYTGSAGPAGPTGNTGPQGAPGIQGIPGAQGPEGRAGYTGSKGDKGDSGAGTIGYTGSPGNLGYTGSVGDPYKEPWSFTSSSSGTVVLDADNKRVFRIQPLGSFSVNVTNLNVLNGFTTSIVLVIQQGGTAYLPTSFSIAGTQVTDVKWQGGSAPTGNANKYDTIAYSIYNASGNYLVLAQLIPFG